MTARERRQAHALRLRVHAAALVAARAAVAGVEAPDAVHRAAYRRHAAHLLGVQASAGDEPLPECASVR
ncbi:hypothetical protein [Cryptosporangium minutisporangium]|uniref:hypothetical protein n=1 Tax=Cryptosporangium minutisporangium TaxID=113569 RepID=UPI0031EA3008